MKTVKNDFFSFLIFLYFLTLHADRLNLIIGGYTIRINNIIGFLIALLFFCRFRDQLFSMDKKFSAALLMITFALLFSAIHSPYRERCLFYLGWFGITLLCYLLLPFFLVKMWDAKRILALYLASFICVGCYAMLQVVASCAGFKDPFVDQYIHGTIVRPNALCFEPSYYALYMTPFVFMYNTYFLSHDENSFFLFRKKSIFHAVGINLLYLLSTSTAVFFAYLIFFCLAFFFRSIDRQRLYRFLLCFASAMTALLIFLPFVAKNLFMKFFFYGFISHHSFFERWLGLVNGWKIFLRHPFFGVGLGGYPAYLMDAYLKEDSAFLFISSHHLIGELGNPIKLFDAMNVTTELLASLGIFGFLAFSWLFGLFFIEGKKQGNGKCLPFIISMAVTLVVLQFSQGLFRTYIWVHFALAFSYFKLKESHEAAATYHYSS